METSKEWADRTFEKATWWNLHPDRAPQDFGVPDQPYSTPVPKSDELETVAEWERMKMDDITLDEIY